MYIQAIFPVVKFQIPNALHVIQYLYRDRATGSHQTVLKGGNAVNAGTELKVCGIELIDF